MIHILVSIEGLHGMRNMTFYNTKYVIHGYGQHARHLWGQFTMAARRRAVVSFSFSPRPCIIIGIL